MSIRPIGIGMKKSKRKYTVIRLYCIILKVLKRSAVSVDDLYYFYVSAIRPVLEYACPVWHTSLTKEQTKHLNLFKNEHLESYIIAIVLIMKIFV